MALSKNEAVETTLSLLPGWETEKRRLDIIDAYLRGKHHAPYQPKVPNSEYQKLVDRSISNWLPLVVSAQAQALYVEGYRRRQETDNARAWDFWQANGLDRRQSAITRAALGHGHSYATVLPGDTAPVIRGVSARKMFASYVDPAEDDWPVYAVRVESAGDEWSVRLYDDTQVYFLTASGDLSEVGFIDAMAHDVGVCPVVRFTDELDLDGRTHGQVEPLIPVQDRINQTAFDLLLAQTYGAFKVRTVSGMELPQDLDTDDSKTAAQKQAARRSRQAELAVNRFLVAPDPDTKFGQLDETPLDGFISSLDTSVRHLAAISQTPPHHLLGQMANLSAEALAAAEAGLTRKVEEHKHTFGESWEQTLRLASAVAGDGEAGGDYTAQVVWRDTESRSLAQTADALGKLATMLQIPPQALWERIPGVTQTDVETWKALAEKADSLGALSAMLNAQTAPVTGP